MNDDPLDRVTRAYQGVTDAALERDQAIIAAHDAGNSWEAVARAAGVTLRSVMKIVERIKRGGVPRA
ncbi:hypothetical protein GCM10009785_01410 [Brooklawnia cerclae]|uniref:Uncharacterized protein n=1 Tax=Brooklawnia cerclae TaxID=349934 RepID=A0ABX0SEF9_9ACTN|nr:helix-turn-helix domain-containing protein [Brooklawnia cerclae]NIH56264.1 hypothetical protein [Brooklawnia cerclae]